MDCQEETVCILKLQGMFLLVQKYYSLLNALCCARLVGRWIYRKRATLGIDSKFVLLWSWMTQDVMVCVLLKNLKDKICCNDFHFSTLMPEKVYHICISVLCCDRLKIKVSFIGWALDNMAKKPCSERSLGLICFRSCGSQQPHSPMLWRFSFPLSVTTQKPLPHSRTVVHVKEFWHYKQGIAQTCSQPSHAMAWQSMVSTHTPQFSFLWEMGSCSLPGDSWEQTPLCGSQGHFVWSPNLCW